MKRFVIILTAFCLFLFGGSLAIIASTANAIERNPETMFRTSPNDITNTRVLEHMRHEREKAWTAQKIEQLALLREVPEHVEETYYEESFPVYAGYPENGGSWRYTEYYPSENTGAFAYAPDLEITLGADGAYRDQDGYVVVASSSLGKFDTVETPYGQGKVYDTGCAAGVVDIYTNNE